MSDETRAADTPGTLGRGSPTPPHFLVGDRIKNAALLIIDMINEFVHPEGKLPVAGARATIPRLAKVLAAWRAAGPAAQLSPTEPSQGAEPRRPDDPSKAGRPVVHVIRQHRPDGSDVESVRRKAFQRLGGFCLPGSWGVQIVPKLTPLPDETVVVKHGWSAFFETNLHQYLRRQGVDTLVVGGTQTPNCIRATVYDATALGYRVVLLGDGTSAATPEVQQANLRDIAAMGVTIVDCADLIATLQEEEAAEQQIQLRAVLPEERASFSRTVIQTVREGDLRLDAIMRLPLLAWYARHILHRLYHRRSQALILEVASAPVGFLVLRPAGDALRVEALGVLPPFRRQGWGQWLLDQAAKHAQRLGLARLELEVSPGNKPALDLYWRAGFRPIPRRWGALWLEQVLAEQEETA